MTSNYVVNAKIPEIMTTPSYQTQGVTQYHPPLSYQPAPPHQPAPPQAPVYMQNTGGNFQASQIVSHQAPGPTFKTAVPLNVLGQGAAPVDCPACNRRTMTIANFEVGSSTHLWALGFCLLLGLGCIPYLMDSTKDVRHHCGNCGALLATWKRSGHTIVHIHG